MKGKNSEGLGRSFVHDKARQNPEAAAKLRRQKELNEVTMQAHKDPKMVPLPVESAATITGKKKTEGSVTERSEIEEIIETSHLANEKIAVEREYQVVLKQSALYLPPKHGNDTPIAEEAQKNVIAIPRRPDWSKSTPLDVLDKQEKAAFLEWRRDLASKENEAGVTLTPYEKSLDMWRQLWRVIEKSDVIVQVVDARDPNFFSCGDVFKYSEEVSLKMGKDIDEIILMNKSDLLSENQRIMWARYLKGKGRKYIFFSALVENMKLEEERERSRMNINDYETHKEDSEDNGDNNEEERVEGDKGKKNGKGNVFDLLNEMDEDNEDIIKDDEGGDDDKKSGKKKKNKRRNKKKKGKKISIEDEEEEEDEERNDEHNASKKPEEEQKEVTETKQEEKEEKVEEKQGVNEEQEQEGEEEELNEEERQLRHDARIVDSTELLDIFSSYFKEGSETPVTIGMVGYPNVGKSSTINALCGEKRVGVTSTPGKTKHFQTIMLTNEVTLCDCPGLVFPTFVNSKAEMVCNGVLSIDQCTDYLSPVALICQRIPAIVLREKYSVDYTTNEEANFIRERKGDIPADVLAEPREAQRFLSAIAVKKSFMTRGHGMPDQSRAARMVVKDYLKGTLFYGMPPPGVSPDEYQAWQGSKELESLTALLTDDK